MLININETYGYYFGKNIPYRTQRKRVLFNQIRVKSVKKYFSNNLITSNHTKPYPTNIRKLLENGKRVVILLKLQ